MTIHELEIGWAVTAAERRYLHWELLSSVEVLGVFLTARDGVLAVLFDGGRREFREWTRTLAPCSGPRHLQTHRKGASR